MVSQGYLLTMAMFAVYSPRGGTLLILILYSGFLATVLFMIVSMNDPFRGIAQVSPAPFEALMVSFSGS